jgi:G3E family GTPase
VPLSPGESTLLSGYRGSGKSTELRRLKQYLENDRYAVVLVDIEDEAKVNALDRASRVGSTEIEESDRDCRE